MDADEPTNFTSQWNEFTQAPDLRVTFGYHRRFPEAAADPYTIARLTMPELRKLCFDFFSRGCVHQTRMARQLEELL